MQSDLPCAFRVICGFISYGLFNKKCRTTDAVIALTMTVRDEYSEVADVSGDRAVTSFDTLMILQAVGTVS